MSKLIDWRCRNDIEGGRGLREADSHYYWKCLSEFILSTVQGPFWHEPVSIVFAEGRLSLSRLKDDVKQAGGADVRRRSWSKHLIN